MIVFACPQCYLVMKSRDNWAGTKGKCPHCGQRILVPKGVRPIVPANGTALGSPVPIAEPSEPLQEAEPIAPTEPATLPETTLYTGSPPLPGTEPPPLLRPAWSRGRAVYFVLGACVLLGIFLYGIGVIVADAQEFRQDHGFWYYAGSPWGNILKLLGILVSIATYILLVVVFAIRQSTRD